MTTPEVFRALKERPTLLDELHKSVRLGKMSLATLAGSRAYGLAHANSDLDIRGVYLAPSREFLGLKTPPEQFEASDPDVVLYELGKFVRLASASNPAALEVLFSNDLIFRDEVGKKLQEKRYLFLSQLARDRYVGYANSQLVRVKRELKGAEPTDRFKEATRLKHLRHIFRLMDQGYDLLLSGSLSVVVKDPDSIRARAALPLAEIEVLFEETVKRLKAVESPLPPKPDMDAINEFVIQTRLEFS